MRKILTIPRFSNQQEFGPPQIISSQIGYLIYLEISDYHVLNHPL